MAKKIKLTQGQFATVDDWNYEYLSQWKWFAQWDEHTKSFYAARNEGRPQKKVSMHRVVANTPDGLECDHKNHDTLDNQEENLANVTQQENAMNKRLYSNNELGERCIRKHINRYVVRVKKENKFILYKSYETLKDAIFARDKAMRERLGIIK